MPFQKTSEIVENVKNAILERNWPAEGHTLSVRSFARRWEISHKTAHRVLRTLRDMKLLAQDERTGSYVVPGAPPRPRTAATAGQKTCLYGEIAGSLRKDIVEGIIAPGSPIPDMKALGARFGCSYPTIRSALARLTSQRLVERRGRHFVASTPPAPPPRSRSRIYFTSDQDLLTRYHSHVPLLLSGAERALHTLQWPNGLDFYFTDRPGIGAAPPEHRVAGFVYFKNAQFELWKEYFMRHKKVPLVIIDPAELLRSSIRFRAYHGRCFVLTSANRDAGFSVGRHLAAMRVRRAAFFTHAPLDRGWTRLRWDGLADGLGEKGTVRLFQVADTAAPGAATHKRLNELTDVLIKANGVPATVVRTAASPLHHLIEMSAIQSCTTRAFSEAFANKSITAWVCINDDLAVAAHSFLASQKAARAASIHLAGFDNSPASLALGFTSYDFEFDKLGHLAVECIARPESVPFDEDGVVRVEGKLYVRGQPLLQERKKDLGPAGVGPRSSPCETIG